ncbi:MAG: AsmA-like C-terminal domain-containing protein [Planctomycetota bacterium]
MTISRANRKHLLKNVVWWSAFCLILLTIGFHASMKLWLGPGYVGMRIEQTLSHFWSGPVLARDIEFNYDGVMFVQDVIFYDSAGTEVMKAGGVKLVLGNWPSLTAPARRIEVERLDVRLRLDDGKLVVPLKSEQNSDSEQSSLEYMSVKDITIGVESDGSNLVLDRLFAEIARDKGLYKLNIGNNDDSSRIQIDGTIDPNSQGAELKLKFVRTMERGQMGVLLSAMNVPERWSCEGKVDADLRIRGNLSQAESLWPEGVASFKDWTIYSKNSVVSRELGGELFVRKRLLNLEQVNGTLCSGQFKASFYTDLKQTGPIAYGGDILAADINLAELTALAETTKIFTKGTGLLNIQFAGDAGGIESIKADGSALIDNADLWRLSLIGELFKNIGIWEYQLGGMSDAEVVFRLSGPEITIERAHLSNRFSAIEAEPGGRIDLRSGQVDMLVVVMPLKNVDKLISSIPVVNWFANFKDKLIRLRLKGHWSDPASKLISKQPIQDLKDGTIGFIIDIAESGGQFTDKVKNKFGLGQADKKPTDE